MLSLLCTVHNLFKCARFGLWPYLLFGTIFFFAILGLVIAGFWVASAKLLLSVMDVGLCGGLLNSSFSTLIFSDGTLPLLFLVPALPGAALVVLAFGLVPALATGLTVVFTAGGAGGLGLVSRGVALLDAPGEGGADGGADAPVDTGAGVGAGGAGGAGTRSSFFSALELPA